MTFMASRDTAFGDWLRVAREEAGISQRGLAASLGIKQPVLSRMENGLKAKLSREEVIRIAEAINRTAEEALEAAGMKPGSGAPRQMRSDDSDHSEMIEAVLRSGISEALLIRGLSNPLVASGIELVLRRELSREAIVQWEETAMFFWQKMKPISEQPEKTRLPLKKRASRATVARESSDAPLDDT